MIRKITSFSIICCLFLFCFSGTIMAQSTENSKNNVTHVTGNFSWEKLTPQTTVSGMCESSSKTIVFIYSDASNFVLADGDALIHPIFSSPFVENIKKYVFCLSHPTPDFVVPNDTLSNSSINAAAFIVTPNAEKLPQIAALVEKALLEENLNSQASAPANQYADKKASVSEIPSPVTFALSWHKLTPHRIEKAICDDPNKTMIFIYSDLSNFVIKDGESLAHPVSSTLFVQNIKQNIFCVEHPGAGFEAPSYIENTNIQREAAAFVVSRSNENLSEIANLIEQTLKIQQDSLNRGNQEIAAGTFPAQATEEKKQIGMNLSFSNQENYKSLNRTLSQEELIGELKEDDYGYRIQLMAKLRSDFTPQSIDNYFKIPYKIRIDYDGTWHRFTVGYFKTLNDAQTTLAEIHEKYHLKEYPFASLYKNDTRVCIFLQ